MTDLHKNFTPDQRKKILDEAFSDKVRLTCGKHDYVASNLSAPTSEGCKDCWLAFYMHHIASTPAHLRQEKLDQLEQLIRHMVEAALDGTLATLQLDSHPTIQIEKGN